MKGFVAGLVIGSAISLLLYPLMYLAGSLPAALWSDVIFRIGLVLWPTSIMLMAIQQPGIFFSVFVLGLAILSNGLLYGLIVAFAFFVTGEIRVAKSRWRSGRS